MCVWGRGGYNSCNLYTLYNLQRAPRISVLAALREGGVDKKGDFMNNCMIMLLNGENVTQVGGSLTNLRFSYG